MDGKSKKTIFDQQKRAFLCYEPDLQYLPLIRDLEDSSADNCSVLPFHRGPKIYMDETSFNDLANTL
jgi:hypothetical protein